MNIYSLVTNFPHGGLFFVLVVGGLGFPFPEGVTLIAAGFLISAGLIKPLTGLLIAFVGVLAGDFLSYYLGRKYGREIVSMRAFRKVIRPEKLSHLEKKFDEKGPLFIFIVGRLISGVFLVAGMLKMPFHKVAAIDVISAILAIGLWVGIGYAGGSSLAAISRDIKHMEHIGIIAAVIATVLWLFYRYFRSSFDRS